MMEYTPTKKRGFALLLSIIVASVTLAVGLSILRISTNQLRLSSTARESEISFQASQAGIECIQYWRRAQSSSYTTYGVTSAPNITCFNSTPSSSSFNKYGSASSGYSHKFTYRFDWADGIERCTDMTLWIMGATNGDYSLTFTGYPSIGTNGTKTCTDGNVCTVVFSRGYNRPCADLETSIFTVERELVVEY